MNNDKIISLLLNAIPSAKGSGFMYLTPSVFQKGQQYISFLNSRGNITLFQLEYWRSHVSLIIPLKPRIVFGNSNGDDYFPIGKRPEEVFWGKAHE